MLKIASVFIILLINVLFTVKVAGQETATQSPRERVYPEHGISGLLQTRYEMSLTDSIDALGRFTPDPVMASFRIRRAYLRYDLRINPNFSGTIRLGLHEFENPPNRVLQYAYITYAHTSWLNLRVGQLKSPFSGEEQWSASNLLLIERGLTNAALRSSHYLSHQQGLLIFSRNPLKKGSFNYSAGVFNGSGINKRIDDIPGKHYVARVTYNPWDFLHIGANGLYEFLRQQNTFAWGGDAYFEKSLNNNTDLILFTEYNEGVNRGAYLADTTGRSPAQFTLYGWQASGKIRFKVNFANLHSIEFGGRYEETNPVTFIPGNKIINITPHFGINIQGKDVINFRINAMHVQYENQEIPNQKNHTLLLSQLQIKF